MAIITSVEEYTARHPKSKALYEKAKRLFPGGVTHDLRYFKPFPIYVTHTKGAHKWDVDGHKYICYYNGHGASILGYSNPVISEAVKEQIDKGTHYSACHELEIELAERIQKLFPMAEKLRFTGSGTEANMMAIRLSRAATGRQKIIKFQAHFHGWWDHLAMGISSPFDQPATAGLLPDDVKYTIVLPVNDEKALGKALSKRDVAAAIFEGAGCHVGQVPVDPKFAQVARDLCTKYGTVLIFDEVITGFRWSPGGWQATIGVKPDLTTLAKILMGALPGGVVAGKAEILDMIQHRDDDPNWNRFNRVSHPGTFNANPLSTAAGIAAMKLIETGEPQRKADAMALKLRTGMHGIIQERGIEGAAYGDASVFHVYIGPCDRPTTEYSPLPPTSADNILEDGMSQAVRAGIARNFLFNGIHSLHLGFTSISHSDEDVGRTLEVFGESLDAMIADGTIKPRA